jgi:regulator of protease activity HflC (stomatin/prohibitin superfamily)
MDAYVIGIVIFVALIIFFKSFLTVKQGTIAVITIFGKYRRMMKPGLNIKVPIIESMYSRISTQNRSTELSFQATTSDQANVFFKAMLLYAVIDSEEDTIKNVAFKFVDEKNFMQALIRTIEGTIRAYVATRKQAEVLSLRNEIVFEVKKHIDETLKGWGYHLIDLQLNDITFDEEIMKSMARVVASNNLKAAAENEGQALLITKTKGAEAEGNAIKISAQAEKEAAQLRGQGIASFRSEVAKGMAEAAKEMHDASLDSTFLLFSMWTEAIKHFGETGKGNVIFLDGSTEGMKRTMQQMMSMSMKDMTEMK